MPLDETDEAGLSHHASEPDSISDGNGVLDPSPQVRAVLSDEELAELKRIQRKRFIVAAIAGVVLMIVAFFAGQNLADRGSESIGTPERAVSVVVLVQPHATQDSNAPTPTEGEEC